MIYLKIFFIIHNYFHVNHKNLKSHVAEGSIEKILMFQKSNL